MARLVLFLTVFLSSAGALGAPLRIAVSESLLSLPFYVAESEGFFQKRGVSIELVNCMGGNRCLNNMLNGQTELSTSTELPVVLNAFTRNDFAILTSFVSSFSNVKILARTESGIDTPHKLLDKTVGYVKGSSSQYVLDLALVYSGIDPNTVRLKQITPENALAALANKEIDAISIWEPFVSRIRNELGADVRLVPIPKLYTETFNLIAMRDVIKNKPQELERLMFALKDSTQFIQAHPDKTKALAAKRLNVPAKLIEEVFGDYRFRLSLNRSLSRTIEGQARWAVREGHIRGASPQPSFNDFLYPVFLKAVDPAAVMLR